MSLFVNKHRAFSNLMPIIGLSVLTACSGVPGDITTLDDEFEDVNAIGERHAREIATIEDDIAGEAAPGEEETPPLVDAEGEPMVIPAWDEQREKIFNALNPDGSRSRQRGAIQITFNAANTSCSGSILNNGVVITAAHCLPIPNRNRAHDVTIFYEYPADPDQGFCPDCGPPTRTWRFTNMFFYHHPNQTRTSDFDFRWDFAVGAICTTAGAGCDSGGGLQSLGLNSSHFVTLSEHVLVDNNGLTVHGYGAPEVGAQHLMGIRVDDAEPDAIDWVWNTPATWWCDGDSGGPAFRNSGYTDRMGRYWQSQAAVMAAMNTNATLGGDECGDTGRSSNIRKKTAWVESIVSFWTGRSCPLFTNLAGEPARRCW
jgi:hypothetical protein